MSEDAPPVLIRRRNLLKALALASLTGTGLVQSGGAAVRGGGKPQFQGDAANTGYVPDECPPSSDLEQQWDLYLPELELSYLVLTAVDGAIFAFAEESTALTKVNPETGTIQWRWQTGNSTGSVFQRSHPATDGDTVYVGTSEPWDRAGVHGLVYALDASDGSVRWKYGVGRGPAYVTLDGGALYVGSQGALYVNDASDGSHRWGHVPQDSNADIGHPAALNDTVVYTTDVGRLYAVDASTGSQRWMRDVAARSDTSVANGRVFVGQGDAGPGVRAVNVADGSDEWEFSAPGRVTHAPIVDDDHVYAWCREGDGQYDDPGVLSAMDTENGELRWEFRTPGINWDYLPPLVAGDAVLVVGIPFQNNEGNDIFVVDANTGQLRTQIEIYYSEPGMAAPVVLDETLFVLRQNRGGHLSSYTGITECEEIQARHTLMIAANGPTDYRLTVDGTLEPDTQGGNFRSESDDEPVENADGTLTVSDGTGPAENYGGTNFHGDRHLFTGTVEDLDVEPRNPTYDVHVYLDERSTRVDAVRGFDGGTSTHTLMITANGPTDYRLTVDGTLEPDTRGGDYRSESDDTPIENADGTLTVSDGTGPARNFGGTNIHGDRFVFSGSITEFTIDRGSPTYGVHIYIDEELVSLAEARNFGDRR